MKKKSYLNLSIDKFATGAAILLVVCNVAQAQTNTQSSTINITETVTKSTTGTTVINKTVNTSSVNSVVNNIDTTIKLNGNLINAGVLAGNTQILTGSSSSDAILQNVIVGEKLKLSATAIGNIIGGDQANIIGNNSQSILPGALVSASTTITGPNTQLKDLEISATAVGNIISGTTIAKGIAGAGTGVISGNSQIQAGRVEAKYTWDLDPTTFATITATALGNAIMLNAPTPKVQ
ncbi:MAG: hypothetical protein LW629_06815 [Burkholderiales bacterium]|jgi:hypothetical protein|nr:hypothetical protein [Burkholderiales bacterium]